ncbi:MULTISPECIES: efflux RND transporter periplasmic adaptor subunit [Dictyoglomus]|uniref:Efflux transporter, RND family, MFP subunit n=1 Tax=Dictyoglomus turgidum (strain DSM 6724 / Z-1310) TaxID=515635 RepID=B8DZT8_DICTD|nr:MULTISPECIES: biotin/lipoyl-binding protein [Dictyoglomus]ACK42021.1 efflux transporter, RND family, MFP subunit [Dictyoglomus turgidum DSM 6724]HBU31418.1 RND transporter [Dictyoglomus sp.]
MKRILIVVFIIIALALTIFYKLNNTLSVKVERVNRKNLNLTINLSGNLSFLRKIEIYPKISGTVREVRVKPGDKVKKGEVLAIIDAEDLKKQIEQIKNIIELAKISSAFSTFNPQSEIKISQDQIKTLESYYESLNKLYEERIIRSPINGIIAKINISPLETVQASQNNLNLNNLLGNFANLLNMFNLSLPQNNPAFIVIDPTSLNAILKVDENNILKIKEGQKAVVNVDALDQNPWEGKVASISKIPSLNKDGTYSYEIYIPLPQLGEMVVEGMTISATINIGEKKNILTIPLNAITFKEGKTYVYLYENGRAKEKEIMIGDMTLDEIEIKEGLREGDLVIISPIDKISNNMKVKIENSIK